MRLLAFMRPFRWRVFLAVLLGCVTVASNVGLLAMAAYLIADAALKPLLILLTLPIYMVRFMGVSRAVARYGERLVSHDVTFRLLAALRAWFYARLEPLAPAALLELRSGDVLARLVGDVDELQNLYLRAVAPLAVAVVIAALTWALFAIFSVTLAWTALAFLLAAGVGVPLLAAALARGVGARQLAARAELNAQLVDGIQGVQDLLACGQPGVQRGRIASLDGMLARLQRRMALVTGAHQALDDLLMNGALWVILALAIPLVAAGRINGVYLAFLALVILSSFEAVQPLGQALQFLGRSLAAGERVFAVADTPVRVREPSAPIPAPSGRTLEFAGVTFAYPEAPLSVTESWDRRLPAGPRISHGSGVLPGVRAGLNWKSRREGYWREDDRGTEYAGGGQDARAPRTTGDRLEAGAPSDLSAPRSQDHCAKAVAPALDGVSLRLGPGRCVAVVGPSGSGKSTLARLALRFWDPDSGVVRLDGRDVRDYALDDVRAAVAVVAQDTYIFNDTLRGNLLLARPDASGDEIARALDGAQLTQFVRGLPDGLDTWVGEQGLRLSGGERQRVAIARALLKDAPLLLLDEATANLDPITERALLDALDALMRGRTTLMITHRLVAMERMDEILVLDRGRVVERGTHAQLRAAHGLYRRLLDTQNRVLTDV